MVVGDLDSFRCHAADRGMGSFRSLALIGALWMSAAQPARAASPVRILVVLQPAVTDEGGEQLRLRDSVARHLSSRLNASEFVVVTEERGVPPDWTLLIEEVPPSAYHLSLRAAGQPPIAIGQVLRRRAGRTSLAHIMALHAVEALAEVAEGVLPPSEPRAPPALPEAREPMASSPGRPEEPHLYPVTVAVHAKSEVSWPRGLVGWGAGVETTLPIPLGPLCVALGGGLLWGPSMTSKDVHLGSQQIEALAGPGGCWRWDRVHLHAAAAFHVRYLRLSASGPGVSFAHESAVDFGAGLRGAVAYELSAIPLSVVAALGSVFYERETVIRVDGRSGLEIGRVTFSAMLGLQLHGG